MRQSIKKILMAFLGVVLIGVSVALLKTSNLGCDPFTCLCMGIWNMVKLSYPIVYVLLNALLLIGIFVLHKEYIGIATAFNIFIVGLIAEKCMSFFSKLLPNPELYERGILLIFAVILLSFSVALCFTANLGVSAYDAIGLLLAEHKVATFRFCRISTDILCITLGLFFGATVGIGTLVTALCMGPFIHLFSIKIIKILRIE